jgi:hypothetical protein
MKKYIITLQNGESFTVNGNLITQSEATGHIFIYFEKDPTWANISAIVPASACVVVIG